ATRKRLEHVWGLELRRDGEACNSEWKGQGRKFGMRQVEGLEQVVSALDRG
ncbi:hypothetical protein LY76DRAFT_479854, partial [Colletotrichum caudatum]